MKILIYFLLITSSEQNLCISRENYFSFSTLSFNRAEFENTLMILQPSETNTTECYIQITLSYTTHHLEVIFNPEISPHLFIPEKQVRLRTTFILDSDPISIVSVLTYNCSKHDACERDFLLDRLPLLLEQDYKELNDQLLGVFFEDEDERIEHIRDLSTSDANFHKYCAFVMKTPLISASFRDDICDNDEKKSTNITITTAIYGKSKPSLDLEISYICLFYGCNDKATINNILAMVQKPYHVSNMMFGTNTTRNLTSIPTSLQTTPTNSIEISATANVSNRLSTTTTTTMNNACVRYFRIESKLIFLILLLLINS